MVADLFHLYQRPDIACCGRAMGATFVSAKYTPDEAHLMIRKEIIRTCASCGNTLTIELQAKDLDDD